jgi:hypothetical protein
MQVSKQDVHQLTFFILALLRIRTGAWMGEQAHGQSRNGLWRETPCSRAADMRCHRQLYGLPRIAGLPLAPPWLIVWDMVWIWEVGSTPGGHVAQ